MHVTLLGIIGVCRIFGETYMSGIFWALRVHATFIGMHGTSFGHHRHVWMSAI